MQLPSFFSRLYSFDHFFMKWVYLLSKYTCWQGRNNLSSWHYLQMRAASDGHWNELLELYQSVISRHLQLENGRQNNQRRVTSIRRALYVSWFSPHSAKSAVIQPTVHRVCMYAHVHAHSTYEHLEEHSCGSVKLSQVANMRSAVSSDKPILFM